MYQYLLVLHSLFRWLVLISLIYALFRGIRGIARQSDFTTTDNSVRHITATIAHIQLAIGYVLYFNSPVVSYFRSHYKEAVQDFNYLFFGLIHICLMTIAVILITIGSSAAKRCATHKSKFVVMTAWYAVALIVIFIAIPWPFSPLAKRPLIRPF